MMPSSPTGAQISTIIIHQEVYYRDLLRQTLGGSASCHVIAETDSFVYGYELIRQNHPRLVLIDWRDDGQKTLDLVRRITTLMPECFVVVTVPSVDVNILVALMQAGAREYLQTPFTSQDVIDLVDKDRAILAARGGADGGGRIITVFSNKGGIGKTFVSVNFALALSEVTGKSVALVDLNLQLGDVTTFLDIVPKQTIADVAKNISRVDTAYLESSLAQYKDDKAHVYVLADPLSAEDAEEITAEDIQTVLTVLKASFDYVVVDTNSFFDTKTLTALDLADQILLIAAINLPCIRSIQKVLEIFARLGYDEQKIRLVINRYVSGEEITVKDIEDILEHPVYWKIPNNYYTVMTAINRGVPIKTLSNGFNVHCNLLDLARQITGKLLTASGKVLATPNAPEKPPSLLSRLFKTSG